MSSYPVILDLAGRLCVVVGAGPVGCRKANGLLEAGARVRMVSKASPVEDGLAARVDLRIRPFAGDDLDGAFLAFAATGVASVDRLVCAAAASRGILVSSASAPDDGDFRLPATLRRGDLLISVATGGRSPALSTILRDRLAQSYGACWGDVVEILGRLRTRKLTGEREKSYSCEVLNKLLAAGLAELVAGGRTAEINNLLTRVIGEATSLDDLGVVLRDTAS